MVGQYHTVADDFQGQIVVLSHCYTEKSLNQKVEANQPMQVSSESSLHGFLILLSSAIVQAANFVVVIYPDSF